MKRPAVTDENYNEVMQYGQGGDSFDDALDQLLEQAPDGEIIWDGGRVYKNFLEK